MAKDFNLTGTWVGTYRQFDSPSPITAELHQAGENLTGTMRDGEPDKERSVTEVAPGWGEDERIVASLRAMFPDAPAAPIRYVTHLPPDSTLEGWVRGPGIYFVKSYQGTSFGGYRVGDRVFGRENRAHSVHYSGRLSLDGGEIEGRWWIDPSPESGGRRTEGSFVLRRRDAAESVKDLAEGETRHVPG